MTTLLVIIGAAVGAPLRHLVNQAVGARREAAFPWATLLVNVTGCLLLGVLAGLPADPARQALLGAGLAGALTTYSTFSHETVRLLCGGAAARAMANVALSLAAGLLAAYAGLALAGAVVEG